MPLTEEVVRYISTILRGVLTQSDINTTFVEAFEWSNIDTDLMRALGQNINVTLTETLTQSDMNTTLAEPSSGTSTRQ